MSEELVTIRLSPRRAAALERVINLQLVCEESGMFPAIKETAEERDQTMHGDRLPVQDGDAVIYRIACRAAVLAERMEDDPSDPSTRRADLPACRWVADDSGIPGGVACTRCGKAEGPGMARAAVLRSMVDGTYRATRRAIERSLPRHEQSTITRTSGQDISGPPTLVDLGFAISDDRDEGGNGRVTLAGVVRRVVMNAPIDTWDLEEPIDGGGYLGEGPIAETSD